MTQTISAIAATSDVAVVAAAVTNSVASEVITSEAAEATSSDSDVVYTYSTVTVAPYGNGTAATSTPCGSSGFLTKAKATGTSMIFPTGS